MAQKRMIDKKISLSEKVADMPLGAQLLYTWMNPHADDLGLLQGSPRTIKAQVIPMLDTSLQEVTDWINLMIRNELLLQIEIDGRQYYYINHFEKNQTLKKDRNPQTILPIKLKENAKESWELCYKALEDNGIHLEDNDFQMEPEEKLSEEKLSEEKEENETAPAEKKINSLVISRSQLIVFAKEFQGLSTSEIKEQQQKCSSYMAMSTSDYKNPGLFFRGWLKKYLEEKKLKAAKEKHNAELVAGLPQLSPEEQEKANKRLLEIRERLHGKFAMPNIAMSDNEVNKRRNELLRQVN